MASKYDIIAAAAVRHADAILTMPKNRATIRRAILDVYEEAYRAGAKAALAEVRATVGDAS